MLVFDEVGQIYLSIQFAIRANVHFMHMLLYKFTMGWSASAWSIKYLWSHLMGMKLRSLVCFLLLAAVVSSVQAQDKLLLNNGKIRMLKGKVVYIDYADVLYQNPTQKEKMEAKLEKLRLKEEAKRNTDAWKAKKEAEIAKAERKKAEQLQYLADRRAQYKKELEERSNSELGPDFEKWKSREEAELKALEQETVLDSTVRAQLVDAAFERKQGQIRNRFTKRVARQLVFSVLRTDGTEEVIYSADTLGFLMDGTTEVEYGVAEMRLYIKGRQDGRKHSFHDVYIGAATGLASGLIFTYTLDMFYAPIPPAICIAVIAGLNNFKPNPKLELTKNLLESNPYMDGYIRSAKGRKIFAFTMGAIGGLGVGIGAAVATSPLLR
jgi:hypothetical protein